MFFRHAEVRLVCFEGLGRGVGDVAGELTVPDVGVSVGIPFLWVVFGVLRDILKIVDLIRI